MLKVLRSLEQESVGINHLRRALVHMGRSKTTRVVMYDDLKGNPFTGSVNAVIVLYMLHGKSEEAVGHYSTIIKNKTHYEYFSSYGLPPAAELAATHSDPDKLARILGKNYRISKAKLQRRFHSNTCARWAFARVLLADLPNSQFVKSFSGRLHLTQPDDVVALATLFCIR